MSDRREVEDVVEGPVRTLAEARAFTDEHRAALGVSRLRPTVSVPRRPAPETSRSVRIQGDMNEHICPGNGRACMAIIPGWREFCHLCTDYPGTVYR